MVKEVVDTQEEKTNILMIQEVKEVISKGNKIMIIETIIIKNKKIKMININKDNLISNLKIIK